MRIHWGLAIAVGATFAWVNLAQAIGPKIDSVRINGERDEAQVSIDGAFSDPQYTVQTRNDGRLIVIDVDNAALPANGIQTSGTNSLVSGTVASNTARGAHIELTLTGKATYHARASDAGIRIKIRRGSTPEHSRSKKASAPSSPKVEDIRIEQKDGRDRIIVSLSGNPEFRVSTRAGALPRLEVLGAKIGENAKRHVEAPHGALIGSIELQQKGDRAIVEVHDSEGAAGTAIRSGRSYRLDVLADDHRYTSADQDDCA